MEKYDTTLLKASAAEKLGDLVSKILDHAWANYESEFSSASRKVIVEELGECVWNGIPCDVRGHIDVERCVLLGSALAFSANHLAMINEVVSSELGRPHLAIKYGAVTYSWKTPDVSAQAGIYDSAAGVGDLLIRYHLEGAGENNDGGDHDPR